MILFFPLILGFVISDELFCTVNTFIVCMNSSSCSDQLLAAAIDSIILLKKNTISDTNI